MSQPTGFSSSERIRAFGYFVIAAVYFFFAQQVAGRAANGLSSGDWLAPVERAILLFLLLVGYGAMGRAFEHQRRPIEAMGLTFRPGGLREFGLGAALAWGMVIVSILPMVLSGGLLVGFWISPHQFWLLLLDLLTLALASLAEEVAFRGYPFQRLIEAIGPVLATLGLSVLFGLAHIFNPNSTRTAVVITIFAGWLLSAAYLRTRALWLAWGWHFGWNVSICILFGLPISGLTNFSPVIQSETIGPMWMTGGDYGPEGSLVAAVVLLVGILALFRITRQYARYAQPGDVQFPGLQPMAMQPTNLQPEREQPSAVPGGIPVDPESTAQDPVPDLSLAPPPEPPDGQKPFQISPNTVSASESHSAAESESTAPSVSPLSSQDGDPAAPIDPPKS